MTEEAEMNKVDVSTTNESIEEKLMSARTPKPQEIDLLASVIMENVSLSCGKT